MRQLATIQKIAEVAPIEGADAIEKVRVNNWWCVAKKGEFEVGTICVYFEIDSLLPKAHDQFSFLAKGTKEKTMTIEGVTYTGYRLKTIRLRGQVSQGLCLPINAAPLYNALTAYEIGQDVSEEIGVVKYEAPMPAELAGKVKGNFPGFIPKTDEERVQNIGDLILAEQGTEVVVTEKLDGTSSTFYKKDGVFGVCSRNLDLLETEGNTHWKIARRLKMEEWMPDNTAIQGEIFGSNIGTNPFKLTDQSFACFNVYSIEQGRYLDFAEWLAFCQMYDIPPVPILEKGPLTLTAEELIAKYDGLKSAADPNILAEGVVIRPLQERRVRMRGQDDQRFSFKVISNAYLLGE